MKKNFTLSMLVPVSGIVLVAVASTGSGCATKVVTIVQEQEGGASSGASGSGGLGTPIEGGASSGTSGASSGTSGTSSGTSGTSGTSGGSGTCPSTATINATTLPWKSPSRQVGACTQTDLNALVSYVDTENDPQKWKSGPWTSSTACRNCVFAQETATTWPPLILDATGNLAEINVGGCIAIASGKDGCGRTYQQWRSCYLEACADCPAGDANAFSTCISAASKGACSKALADVTGPLGCGDATTASDAETKCAGTDYVFEGGVKAQCIGSIP